MNSQPAFFYTENELLYQKRQEEKSKSTARSSSKSSTGRSRKASTPSPEVYNCSTCGLSERCHSPKMQRYGQGQKKILLIGEAPGRTEDGEGKPFVGESGQYLSSVLQQSGIDIDRDCVRTNVIRCHPPRNATPTNDQIKCCFANLMKDIEEVKPQLIICLGDIAMKAVMKNDVFKGKRADLLAVSRIHGYVYPYQNYQSWVGLTYHPASTLYDPSVDPVFKRDIASILKEYLNKPLPKPLDRSGNYLIDNPDDAIEFLKSITDVNFVVSFDYEANQLSPYEVGARPLSIGFSSSIDEGYCIWLDNPTWSLPCQAYVAQAFKAFLASSTPKVVQNFNMEETWSRAKFGTRVNNIIMDTMVASHVRFCKSGTTSLEYQVFQMTGDVYKGDVNIKKMDQEPIERLYPYNCLDARYQYMLYLVIKEYFDRPENKCQRDFYEFLHKGLSTFVDMTERGFPVDRKQLDIFEEEANADIVRYQKELVQSEIGLKFKEKYEHDINIQSNVDLPNLFYNILRTRIQRVTKEGNYSLDAEVIEDILRKDKDPLVLSSAQLVKEYRKVVSFKKRVKEYRGCLKEDGYLHPCFTMNIAETFRSSTTDPNVQNMFKHDEELMKFRKIIIPRPNHIFLESDVNGIEVTTVAMVSGDRTLIRQLLAGVDVHRRWAARLYKKPESEITGLERFNAKNMFVFASLYGAVPASIAGAIGMNRDHIEAVQKLFWEEYAEVKEWQNRTLAEYQQYGFITCVTGFRRYAPLSIEQIYNTPVQGPAFHFVFDAVRRINEFLTRERFNTIIRSETHDSVLFDTHLDELETVMMNVKKIFETKVFDWQRGLNFSISWEWGENYYEMQKLK